MGKNKQMWQAIIGTKGHTTGQKLKRTPLENQPVFCIRTDNESFVVKQDTCITITGNTLYGAGNEKIGGIISPMSCPAEKSHLGNIAKMRFQNSIPAYKMLLDQVKAESRQGFIYALDGRKLYVHSEHVALDVLLQGGGAIVMKVATNILMATIRSENLDAKLVLHVHDEYNLIVREDHAERVAEIAASSIERAGRYLKMNIPMAGKSKIGQTWGEVH